MIFSRDLCARVVDGVVTDTGTFSELIAPTSPFREGFPEERAKVELSVYQITSPSFDAAAEILIYAAPYYDSFDDVVYNATVEDKPLADIAAEKTAAANAERNRRIYLPIGEVDVRGDGTLMIEPDVRNDRDRTNLGDLHSKALSLSAAGVTAAVIPFGDSANLDHLLTPAEMIKLAEAPLDRGGALYVMGRAIKTAVEAALEANDRVALLSIDPEADAAWT